MGYTDVLLYCYCLFLVFLGELEELEPCVLDTSSNTTSKYLLQTIVHCGKALIYEAVLHRGVTVKYLTDPQSTSNFIDLKSTMLVIINSLILGIKMNKLLIMTTCVSSSIIIQQNYLGNLF